MIIHRQQHLHENHKEIADAAMCNEKNAEYYTDVHRPTNCKFRSNKNSQVKIGMQQTDRLVLALYLHLLWCP